jgi:ribosome-binding factor A
MAENRRPDRLAEAIREEVARFVNEKAKDPRITGMVTVTAVEVTRDLRTAKVFVSVLGDADRERTFEGLNSLAGHLRSRLGKTLGLRSAPEILFRNDESVARAARIETLLAQIKENRPDTDDKPGD